MLKYLSIPTEWAAPQDARIVTWWLYKDENVELSQPVVVLGGKRRRTCPELHKTKTEQQKRIYGESQLLQYLSNNDKNASSGNMKLHYFIFPSFKVCPMKRNGKQTTGLQHNNNKLYFKVLWQTSTKQETQEDSVTEQTLISQTNTRKPRLRSVKTRRQKMLKQKSLSHHK